MLLLLMLLDIVKSVKLNFPLFPSAQWERQTSTRGLLYSQSPWLFQPVLKGKSLPLVPCDNITAIKVIYE